MHVDLLSQGPVTAGYSCDQRCLHRPLCATPCDHSMYCNSILKTMILRIRFMFLLMKGWLFINNAMFNIVMPIDRLIALCTVRRKGVINGT